MVDGSAAQAAGVRRGSVVLAVNGVPVRTLKNIKEVMRNAAAAAME